MVVLARIPFAEQEDYKVRPAVVVARADGFVTVLPCTPALSRLGHRHRYHELEDLKSAGLQRPTGLKRASIQVDRTDVLAILGQLGEADAAAVLVPEFFMTGIAPSQIGGPRSAGWIT